MNPALPSKRADRLPGSISTARKLFLSAFLSTSLIAMSASTQASDRRVATERFTEYAPVVDVQPIYKKVRARTPRQECWTEQQQVLVGYEDVVIRDGSRSDNHRSQNSTGNVIVGSVIGGVIGNRLSRGQSSHSRTGATVAGAIIGGAIGNEASNGVSRHRSYERARHVESRPIYETRPVERCNNTVKAHSEQQLQYYNVTYRYKGREFVTQLPRDPGDRIELQVSVSPARR
ncbi:glycine zipper 2TM domain-containing protein [Granulosicoccus antarcticus]|uniref:Glycine zipper 2TM domain-containing protein n=1 Tax=Granulosicoccus antarcticus IMCC3135 TaxID=1192854 RepID=A0A2Z2P325_9GAMM|nr:glycine zipper 2TM domain-containing protein [Granulosicoccus antarcticus]ASJ75017.1 hypothetical protein IMCC3135_24765 [Granulosicoccus antarcticus IMCC3135]